MDIRMKVKRFIKVRKNGIHGDDKDRFYVGSRNFQSEDHTKKEFLNCKERLRQVYAWCHVGNASFSIYGRDGKPLTTVYPVEGDFIRIEFPELFSVCWMRIDRVIEDDDVAEVIATATNDPTDSENRNAVSSKFAGAQSIFRIEKQDNSVFAVVMNVMNGAGGHTLTRQSLNDWDLFLTRPWKSLAEYLVGTAHN